MSQNRNKGSLKWTPIYSPVDSREVSQREEPTGSGQIQIPSARRYHHVSVLSHHPKPDQSET